MPIISDWYDTGKGILIQRFEGQWSLDEYFSQIDHMLEAMLPGSPLHIIADFSSSLTAPTRILGGLRYLQRKAAHNKGISIFLHPNPTLEDYFKLAQHIQDPAAENVYTAHDLPEAVEIITLHSRK